MPESIAGLLEKADLAVAAASRVAEESITAPIAVAAAMLRRRLDHPEDLLLIGLAGGTGSGKSSLVNAIAGREVAVVGGLRPTTDRPLAVANRRSAAHIDGYLNDLGIDEVTVTDVPDWLCLIDLPDIDSVDLGHRLQVEALVPRLDVIVWVVDPEKYRDSSLHHGYLEPMSSLSGRFVFVLNQIDRLSEETGQLVLADFRRAVLEDGIEAPTVLAAAAAPQTGPAMGVEEIVATLRSKRSSGVIARALVDLEEAASALREALGPPDLDFEARASVALGEATRSIVAGSESVATDLLIGFLEDLADETGGITGDRIRSGAARVPRQIRQTIEDLRWRPEREPLDALTEPGPLAQSSRVAVRSALSDRVIGPARETLRERAAVLALVTDLSLSVSEVRVRMGI